MYVFAAFHRGYMKKCYHSECDEWSQDGVSEANYKFMTATAQSLVLSIAEMAMEGHQTSCIKETVQYIVKQASNDDALKIFQTTTQKPKRYFPFLSASKPRFEIWAHFGALRAHIGRILGVVWAHFGRTLSALRAHYGRTLSAL